MADLSNVGKYDKPRSYGLWKPIWALALPAGAAWPGLERFRHCRSLLSMQCNVLYLRHLPVYLCNMDTIKGSDAIAAAEAVTKAGGTFTVAFYSYSRTKRKASARLRTLSGCRTRTPLPHDRFSVDGVHYFLFEAQGVPKMCYKVLMRYIGFPQDGYKLKQIRWYE